jgi:hypothetical protein
VVCTLIRYNPAANAKKLRPDLRSLLADSGCDLHLQSIPKRCESETTPSAEPLVWRPSVSDRRLLNFVLLVFCRPSFDPGSPSLSDWSISERSHQRQSSSPKPSSLPLLDALAFDSTTSVQITAAVRFTKV